MVFLIAIGSTSCTTQTKRVFPVTFPHKVQPIHNSGSELANWTIIGYFNGDNSLAIPILRLVDQLETEGSSENINILILYDGSESMEHYTDWNSTKLLFLEQDEEIGIIRSKAIDSEQFGGEMDLGSPETLERFLRYVLQRYPSKRKMLIFFSHGYGVAEDKLGKGESISLSLDETNASGLSVEEAHDAIKNALNIDAEVNPFDFIIMNACMSNMLELNYAFRDITRYLIGSPDIIPLVSLTNDQLLGIDLLKTVTMLKLNPAIPHEELSRFMVDNSIESYETRLYTHSSYTVSFPVSFSCVEEGGVEEFTRKLNTFSHALLELLGDENTRQAIIRGLYRASSNARHYGGFHYCDLIDLLDEIRIHIPDELIQPHITTLKEFLKKNIVRYERNNYGVPDTTKSHGLSIYFPHPLIVPSVYKVYRKTYRKTLFAQDTLWDEVIDEFRKGAQQLGLNEAYLKELSNGVHSNHQK